MLVEFFLKIELNDRHLQQASLRMPAILMKCIQYVLLVTSELQPRSLGIALRYFENLDQNNFGNFLLISNGKFPQHYFEAVVAGPNVAIV